MKPNLVVGLTEHLAGESNNFRYKPIQFEVLPAANI